MNGHVRSLLEYVSRNRIMKRHLPGDFGAVPILVSPDASLSFWKPQLKSDLFDFAREFVPEGCIVWDIGANVGLFTIAAAQKAASHGKVVAIEADIWLAQLLRRSAALQPESSAHIQVIPTAVVDSHGIASFNIAKRGRASNYLNVASGSSQTGGIRETVYVPTVTLDWLLEQGIPAPRVMKIDVEGAEIYVLQGAKRILAEIKPVILCEVYAKSCNAATEILLKYGYTLFNWDSRPRVRVDRAAYNTLAIPPIQ